jgi:hypothetical protein
MTQDDKKGFNFKSVVVCANPMETEIYPATLREKEIPHRTDWNPDGSLEILVPEEWEAEAKEALREAAKVFFGEGQKEQPEPEPEPAAEGSTPEEKEDSAEQDGQLEFSGLFKRDGLPSPDETRIRSVWPAWVLAALPGTGLGHLYAGKFQMFLYLAFLSVLGILFFEYTGSYFSFLMNGFSWIMDLGFAAYHVKEHNRRARRAIKAAAEAERSFLESI